MCKQNMLVPPKETLKVCSGRSRRSRKVLGEVFFSGRTPAQVGVKSSNFFGPRSAGARRVRPEQTYSYRSSHDPNLGGKKLLAG